MNGDFFVQNEENVFQRFRLSNSSTGTEENPQMKLPFVESEDLRIHRYSNNVQTKKI